MTEKNLKDIITKKALQLGFDKIGFANPSQQVDPNNYFDEWIQSNYHGTMKWMESRKEERKNIFNYFPEVKTVISLAFNYFTKRSSEFSQNCKKVFISISVLSNYLVLLCFLIKVSAAFRLRQVFRILPS